MGVSNMWVISRVGGWDSAWACLWQERWSGSQEGCGTSTHVVQCVDHIHWCA